MKSDRLVTGGLFIDSMIMDLMKDKSSSLFKETNSDMLDLSFPNLLYLEFVLFFFTGSVLQPPL